MRKEICLNIREVTEGMVLARDMELGESQLIPQGTILSDMDIENLMDQEVFALWIFEEEPLSKNDLLFKENCARFKDITDAFRKGKPIKVSDVTEVIKACLELPAKYYLLKQSNQVRSMENYTYEHSLHVCYLAILLGRWVYFPKTAELAQAALLHDLGKIKVDQEILDKPGPLESEEWIQMRQHTLYGYQYLRENTDFSEEVLRGVLYHHETREGSGYPQRKTGDYIPAIAKIISIVDMYDALTSDKVYRKKIGITEALQYISNNYQCFEPSYLHIFVEKVMEQLVGEKVQLTDGSVGKIIFKSPLNSFEMIVQKENEFIFVGRSTEQKIQQII